MHTVFWLEKHFQKSIRHGPNKRIDVYQATLKIVARTMCYTFLNQNNMWVVLGPSSISNFFFFEKPMIITLPYVRLRKGSKGVG